MQIVPGSGLPQPMPNTASTAVVVVGPALPPSPIDPVRRVTAGREGGRGDLGSQHHAQRHHSTTQSRGRLIDLLV